MAEFHIVKKSEKWALPLFSFTYWELYRVDNYNKKNIIPHTVGVILNTFLNNI